MLTKKRTTQKNANSIRNAMLSSYDSVRGQENEWAVSCSSSSVYAGRMLMTMPRADYMIRSACCVGLVGLGLRGGRSDWMAVRFCQNLNRTVRCRSVKLHRNALHLKKNRTVKSLDGYAHLGTTVRRTRYQVACITHRTSYCCNQCTYESFLLNPGFGRVTCRSVEITNNG